jgi:dihydrofolate reductase
MRQIIFGVASSLDNFIARVDHAVDWLLWGKEAQQIMADFWKTFDTVVMGRKTYEVAMKYAGSADPYGMTTYVFSRTLPARSDERLVITAEDAAEVLRRLKQQPGKDICVMGGGELARSLFEADVIDEVGMNVHPVLLGSGIPLFLPMRRQVDLERVECRALENGCVLLRYRVKHRDVTGV